MSLLRSLKPCVLHRYLLRQNLFLILSCLAVGTTIYLLSDLFDRVDDFLEAGLGIREIWIYFLVKLPLIVSQILPAVFLIAMVIQLGIMTRNRELLALQAGGVSLAALVRFFVIYAIFWSLTQLLFSQVLGVYGEQEASRIWQEDVRKKQMDTKEVEDLWFRKGDFLVELNRAIPGRNIAMDVTVYEYMPDRKQAFLRVITAPRVSVEDGHWLFSNATEYNPDRYRSRKYDKLRLPIEQSLKSFLAVDPRSDPAQLPLWSLSKVIRELQESGSNVERLRTSWNMKWSYAFSLVVMALLALALTSFSSNMYLNIGLSLALTFSFYGLTVVGGAIGQKGLMPPIAAAWIGNLLFGGLAAMRIAWVSLPGRAKTSKIKPKV